MSKKYLVQSKGFSIVELMIAAVLTLMVGTMVTSYIFSSWQSNDLMAVKANLKTYNQMTVNRIGSYISQSKVLFENNTVGTSYIAKLDLTDAPKAITGSKLATIKPAGSASPEKTCLVAPTNYFSPEAVGNSLLMAKLKEPFEDFPDNLTSVRAIDAYQFVYIYITDYSDDPDKPYIDYWRSGSDQKMKAQDLREWSSRVYVDYAQLLDYLNDSPTAEKDDILTSLKNAGYKYAWDRTASTANNSIYTLGTTTLTLKASSYKIEQEIALNATRLVSDTSTKYSVAYNQHKDSSQPGYFPIDDPVPLFYKPVPSPTCSALASPVPTASPSGDYKFPRGFEVMITGPNSGRAVLIRLTLVGKGGNKMLASESMTLTNYARDF